MMTLYNLATCPFCRMVRNKLDALGLEYKKIDVPFDRGGRTEVFAVSGQYLVPVLVDEEVVLDDEEKIIEYLEKNYGKGA